MFFIVSHSWDKENYDNVNASIANLFRKSEYGLLGSPWPKLFNFWADPISCKGFSLWEAQNPESLEELLQKIEYIQSSKQHVKQLYPPHINLYNMMDIQHTNPWNLNK